jgi:hypothetical protein
MFQIFKAVLCELWFSFAALREKQFHAKAQRYDLKRKGLSL